MHDLTSLDPPLHQPMPVHKGINLALRTAALLAAVFACALAALLLRVATPQLIFVPQAFAMAAASLIVPATVIAAFRRRATVLLWAVLSVAFAAVPFAYRDWLPYLLAPPVAAAAIHVVAPSRWTTPTLILLPLAATAWLLLALPYWLALQAWAVIISERVGASGMLGWTLAEAPHAVLRGALVVPLLALYALARRRLAPERLAPNRGRDAS